MTRAGNRRPADHDHGKAGRRGQAGALRAPATALVGFGSRHHLATVKLTVEVTQIPRAAHSSSTPSPQPWRAASRRCWGPRS